MSKYQYSESDIYLPGTDIPRNRLNITDPDTLRALEAELLQQAYVLFAQDLDPSVRFDENYFKALHRQTFSTLYDWAGEYRRLDLIKGNSVFCRAEYLAKQSQHLFNDLEKEQFLKQTHREDPTEFAARLAYYQCELIALHPFLELNGRTIRLFIDLIAMYNGYAPIDYSAFVQLEHKNQPNAYIQASIECVQHANAELLRHMIEQGLTSP